MTILSNPYKGLRTARHTNWICSYKKGIKIGPAIKTYRRNLLNNRDKLGENPLIREALTIAINEKKRLVIVRSLDPLGLTSKFFQGYCWLEEESLELYHCGNVVNFVDEFPDKDDWTVLSQDPRILLGLKYFKQTVMAWFDKILKSGLSIKAIKEICDTITSTPPNHCGAW